jgi:hypothetical protein
MSNLSRTARLIASLVVGIVMTACSSAPPPPAPVAAAPPPPPPPATLTQIKADLLKVKAQVNVTTDSVNAVASSSTADDAKANFNRFSGEYAKLGALVESNRSRVQDLKQRSQQYFEAWSKESEGLNPALKRQVMEQRAEVEGTCNTIKSEMELGKLSFDPYMANLKDFESYLRTDLSPARIATTSDLLAKVNEDSKSVNKHVDAVVVQIDKLTAASGEAQTVPAAVH